METVLDFIIGLADRRIKFKGGGWVNQLNFDLENKTIKNGNTYIIKNGILTRKEINLINGEVYDLSDIPLIDKDLYKNPYVVIEDMYEKLKSSIPSSNFRFSNFKFKPKEKIELTNLKDIESSTKALYCLQAYILLGSIENMIPWENDNHFFWKGKNGVIVYRDWIK